MKMKSAFNWWLLLWVMVFVAACSDGGEEIDKPDTPPTPEQPTITLDTSSSDFTTNGGSNTVSFTALADWTAEVINSRADAWCSVSPTSGKAGNAQITITTTANDTPDSRSASVILKAGTTQKTITVSQKQKDALTVTSDKFEVSAEGGEIKIEVKANIDFEYSIAYEGSAKDWITSGGARALKTSTLTFKVAANEEVEKREATVTIKSGSFKEEVKVYQAGTTPSITLTKNEFVVASAGESIAVEVKSNVDVTVELPTDVDWISENQSRAMSTNTYYFTIAESQEYDQRTAEIKFTNKANNLSETVKVVQVQKDAIVVAKDSYTVDNNGGEIIIEVGHNIDFEIEIADEWIVQKKENSRAFVTDKLIFNISPNEGYDNRESSIRFVSKDKGIVQTVKIYQAQKNAIIISQKNIIVDENGGDVEFEVKSNIDYTISEPNVDWLHILKSRALTSQTLRYTVDANTTYDSRETSIIITSDNFADTINIAQTQKDAIVLAKNEYGFTAEGGELDFEILTNVDVTVSIPDSISYWVKQVKSRALVSQILHFDISPCDLSESRSGTITLSGGNAVQKILIKQEQMKIDPAAIPDNEIWYTTTDGKSISLKADVEGWPNAEFNTNVVFNGYRGGKGVIEFDGPVTKIGKLSFAQKVNLESIYLPNSVNYIGLQAFYNCINLNKVTIKSNDLQIEKEFTCANPFEMCSNLQNFDGPLASEDGRCLIVKNSLYSFAPYGITEYTIPQGVTTIEDSSFELSNLKVITIPEGVERIEAHAFAATSFTDYHIESSLEYVYLPSTLKYIHGYAFLYNKNIKAFYGENEFVSPDKKCLIVDKYNQTGNKSIILFASGAGLTEYTIPDGVEAIESYAFYYATSLKKLNFPDSFKEIYSGHAFEGATNIETITGKYVLDDNRSMVINDMLVMYAGAGLEKYTTPKGVKSIGYQALGFNNDIKEYVISDDVTQAGDYGYLFNQCPNLEIVTLSAKMQYLGYDPFGAEWWSTPKIKTVYCRAIMPPFVYYNTSDGRFDFDDLTIFVPEQSVDAYRSSNYWTPYRDYIKGYNYTDLPELDFYISTDYSQDGEVTTLQTATKGDGIDIVLMGDAYSDRQITDGTYKADMEYIYNNLFTEEPYKSFKDYFNVYYVNVVSASEGYEHGGAALGGYFGDGTLVGGNDNAVFDYALNAISESQMDEALLIVAMNSNNYAGTCYMYYPSVTGGYGNGISVSYFPKGENAETFAQLLHHEALGHGFSKLADEYAYEDMGAAPSDYVSDIQSQQNNWGWWKNVDFTSDPSATRWSHFINDTRYANDGLGAYEGGLTYWTGVWRPTENSIMRYNTGGFNAPSREAIYYRIHKLAYGDSWQYDYEEFVKYDAINRKAAASSYNPYRQTNYKPLHAPVVIRKSWKDAK